MSMDPVTLIFAALAIFVIWKLRSVLGERSGFEQPTPSAAPAATVAAKPVEDDRWSDLAERGSAQWRGLDAIAAAQPGFDARSFLDGAREAYKMVIHAFSTGDEATLRSLASDEVFGSFRAAIADRTQRGETLESTFVGFNDVKIAAAVADDIGARIALRFDSQFITVTRNAAGEAIEGDATRPVDIVDVWTFARRHDASGPNWILASTAPTQP